MDLPKEMLMGLMFIVGLVLTIFAFKITNDVNICKVSAAQNALRGLLVMGVMLMSITGTTLGINCNTGKSDSETSVNGMIFVILMLVIGIITTALVSVIHKNCEDARKDTPILLTMSVLIMVVSLGYLGYTAYNNHKSSSNTPSGTPSESPPRVLTPSTPSEPPPRLFTPRPPPGPTPPDRLLAHNLKSSFGKRR
jgi:uncharacterized protein YacL